jgi:hypothetical protein
MKLKEHPQWCEQYVTLHLKMGEQHLKHGGLAQQNGFGLALLHSLLEKGTAQLCTCRRRR